MELSATVSRLLPSEAWQAISVDLYLSFWTLSLQDIHCPTDSCAALPLPPHHLLLCTQDTHMVLRILPSSRP